MALFAMISTSQAASSASSHKKHKSASSTVKGTTGKSGKAGARKSRAPRAKPYRRSYQQAPTADRYKEIQQALAEKGYFKGSVDGNWGADSVDALKRFQAEQSLDPDGKVGSLSLIALGLGPKRLTAQSNPQANSTK